MTQERSSQNCYFSPVIVILGRQSVGSLRDCDKVQYFGRELSVSVISDDFAIICDNENLASRGGEIIHLEGLCIFGRKVVGPSDLLRHQLAAHETRARLRGNFSYISHHQGKIIAHTDILGMSQLYYSRNRDFAYITNEPTLAREVARKINVPFGNVHISAILDVFLTQGLRRDEGPFDGMFRVGVEQVLQVDLNRSQPTMRVKECPAFSSHLSRELNYSDAKEMALRDIRNIVSAYTDHFSKFEWKCDLSGGRDSRMMVAALIAEGLENRFQFSTKFGLEHVDTIVACEIATAFDFQLGRHIGRERESLRKRIARAAPLLAGLRHASGAGLRGGSWEDVVHFAGACGELTRVFLPGRAAALSRRIEQLSTLDVFARKTVLKDLFKYPENWGDFITREGAALASEGVQADLFDPAIENSNDLVYLHYLKYRNRTHFGLQARVVGQRHVHAHPLATPYFIDMNFALPNNLRATDAIPMDIIHSLCPRLANQRFAGTGTSKDVAEWLSINPPMPALDGDGSEIAKEFNFLNREVTKSENGPVWSLEARKMASEVCEFINGHDALRRVFSVDAVNVSVGDNKSRMHLANTIWPVIALG